MAGMSWKQYYDGFYDWSSGTQIRYLARLDSYGSGAQTAEIAAELAEAGDGGPAAAKRLITRAVENGVRFTAEDVIEMAGADIEEDTLKYALATVREPLTGGQIVTLSDYFDEDVLEKLIKDKRGGLTPEEMSSIDARDMSDGKLAKAMAAAEPRLSPGQILALMYALDEETLSRAVTESREPFVPEQITELTDYVSEEALSEAVMRAKEPFTPEQVSDLLYYVDEEALSKAVRSTKEPFTPEQIMELVDNVDEDALSKAVRSAKEPFTPEQVTGLIDNVDDGALSKAVKNTKGQFTKEQREELEDSGFCFSNGIFEDTDSSKESGEPVHEFGGGCLLGLLGIFLGSSKKEDGSSCHDSAPHYGYRYGRWYYGNDHSYGCEKEKKKK